ncbi:MAG TPA: methylmalonyl-CoA mutase family protein [Kofleriaceae bacterium]
MASYDDWKAAVDKELAGAAFDKLMTTTAEGLLLQPLYVASDVDPGLPGEAPYTRGAQASPGRFKICMRVDPPAQRRPGALQEDLDGGADALWLAEDDAEALALASQRGLPVIHDAAAGTPSDSAECSMRQFDRALRDHGAVESPAPHWLDFDHVTAAVRGQLAADALPRMLRALGPLTDELRAGHPGRLIRVSGLAFHDAGADPADELALMLASAAAYLRALTDGGLPVQAALGAMWTQISVGRDTFGELCKLRALRVVWHKLAAAAGVADLPPPMLHAVCASRTQSQRDPWVNLLRVSTEVFAAALGGADFITPLAFDEALGPASALGRRVARNTALVLREESHLGRVVDPAGGSYYIEARTDQLAREAWQRFTAIERDGGVVALIEHGVLAARLEAAWARRAQAIGKRKEPVLGVSEFANPTETLPAPVPPPGSARAHRDGEAFEALRTQVESAPRSVGLILLGPPGEHRGRLGYAAAAFAIAGIRATELAAPEVGGGGALGEAVARLDVACICGSDERYASEAAAHAGELRAAGARKIALAGRPGPREAELRAAGVDAFLYVGCDVLATLTELLS